MKILQVSSIVFLSFFLIGCASSLSPQSTQTETRPTPTTKPTSTNTPSPTATIEPPILESYSHVFAYADGENIIFLDEEARQITKVISETGRIQDFKVSPDNNWVAYSSSNGTKTYFVIQKIGIRQGTKIDFPHQSKNIIYFNWLSNLEFALLTESGYFIGALDGSKSQVNGNIKLSPISRYTAIKSPVSNDLLLYQYIGGANGAITGCAVYILKHENGELKNLINEKNYCYFSSTTNWSPDGKFIGINYYERGESYGWNTTYIFDTFSNNLIHANEPDAIYPFREIVWSPNQEFFSFIQNTFTVIIQKNDLATGEIVLNQDFSIPPSDELLWSPNGRFLMYGRQPKYLYIFDTIENEYKKMYVHDLKGLDPGFDNGSYWWASESNGIFIIPEDYGTLGGIFWYDINSREPIRIGDLVNFPKGSYPNILIRQLENNPYSAIYIISNDENDSVLFNYFILNEKSLQVSMAIKVNNPSYPPPFIWVK